MLLPTLSTSAIRTRWTPNQTFGLIRVSSIVRARIRKKLRALLSKKTLLMKMTNKSCFGTTLIRVTTTIGGGMIEPLTRSNVAELKLPEFKP